MKLFDRLKRRKSNQDFEKICACARYCFNSPEGTTLLEHLSDVFGVDEQVGLVSGDEAIYINGKQDALKYIFALLIEEEDKKEQ